MPAVDAVENSKSEIDKRNRLLQALHRGGNASRLRLAGELRISNSRVCDLVDRMLAEGLLLEQSFGGERRGRRGVGLSLNPQHAHLVGFDMEAKRLRGVVTDFAGQVVWQVRRALRVPKDRRALIDDLLGFVGDTVAEARERFGNVLGVGLAAGGVIDVRRGVVLHYDLVPHARDLPLRDLIAERVGLPCVMENNIRALTLAEWTSGAAKGLSNFICLAVRSGVGAGVVINGRLHGGSHGFCGEIGYMVLPNAGPAARWKSLQQTVSESALGVDAEAKDFHLDEAVARRTGELIGGQLGSICAVFDPEAVVLTGALLQPDGPVWPHAIAAFRKTALVELVERVQILPARLGPFAAAVGAAHRCLYELFPVATPA